MGITSTGIGSGLDVNSIVTQLMSAEKQPLQQLQKASTLNTQISVVGQIQSKVSALQDALSKLSSSADWAVRSSASSNEQAVGVTTSDGASSGSHSVLVNFLAKSEIASTSKITTGTTLSGGSLSISAGGNAPVDVAIADGSSLSQIASAINGTSGVGVSASVIRDGTGKEQLVIKSKTTGESGFKIDVTDNDGVSDDDSGLSTLAYDSSAPTSLVMSQLQPGQNASVTIDGVLIASESNTLTDVLPGVTLNLKDTTTTAAEITVSNDANTMRSRIEAFVTAYNELNGLFKSSLKYDDATKTAGALQGDSTMVGLQRALRNVVGSASSAGAFSRLSDIGVEIQRGGDLKINGTKLDQAMDRFADIQSLFSVNTGSVQTSGIAYKLDQMTSGLIGFDGSITSKTESLRAALSRNTDAQDKFNDRLTRVEARLRAQYTSLDSKMGALQGLSGYVSQQVAQWNKS